MKVPECERIALADLTDYAAGELPEAEAAALEAHLFACADCAARAAEFDGLVRAIRPAVRSAEVGGFMTDAILNRLARESVPVVLVNQHEREAFARAFPRLVTHIRTHYTVRISFLHNESTPIDVAVRNDIQPGHRFDARPWMCGFDKAPSLLGHNQSPQ